MRFKPTKTKRIAFFLISDIIIFAFSLYFSLLLRFSGEIPSLFYAGMVKATVFMALIKIFFLSFYKIYLVAWRFFGLFEAIKIFYAHLFSALIFGAIFSIFSDFFNPFPRSAIIIDAVISFVLICALRVSKRIFDEREKKTATKFCIIFGANAKTSHILKAMRQNLIPYKAVCVISDNVELIGTRFENFVVYPKSKISFFVQKFSLNSAIIALNSDENLSQIHDELSSCGINDIKIFSFFDENEFIKDISIEDLLARKPQDLDFEAIKNFINNKTILITGAGGTIGSEISKQCLEFGAKKLILIDNCEYNLYKIGEILGDEKCELKLTNIIFTDEMSEIFAFRKIDLVIHCAAYKHVPMCEFNAYEAVKNNVLGTKNVIDLSVKFGVKKVVLISSDKAVRPTSIMGATKRICEIYALNSNTKKTQIVAVRFGNVLGSSGSVVPKFKHLIAQNRPLCVTHPEISRYFMLANEACYLVLQAGLIANGGELFVLDMGKPVKIVNLAKKMLKLSNKEHLGIKFTGLRAGEKLFEELLIDKNDVKTRYKSIFITQSKKYDLSILNEQISYLLSANLGTNRYNIISRLKEIVPEFKQSKI